MLVWRILLLIMDNQKIKKASEEMASMAHLLIMNILWMKLLGKKPKLAKEILSYEEKLLKEVPTKMANPVILGGRLNLIEKLYKDDFAALTNDIEKMVKTQLNPSLWHKIMGAMNKEHVLKLSL